ncbi:hypothetical protein F4561_006111 [Lipingzhangella halophila]|uniref:Uncharacterized protein n=1 Tax=Lipingzhangella halophila TaxID=1783352 RepID=A0A7W7W5G6_9ACTN|nr:hypothetical protein [Lipingzhangella halophila]MBB4935217.1 hypothetical protein [Lipingzhangella halophila]
MSENDWWVTAGLTYDRIQRGVGDANTAPELIDSMAELADVHRQSAIAFGASLHALLAGGTTWTEIADRLGAADQEEARALGAEPMRLAEAALRSRLGG